MRRDPCRTRKTADDPDLQSKITLGIARRCICSESAAEFVLRLWRLPSGAGHHRRPRPHGKAVLDATQAPVETARLGKAHRPSLPYFVQSRSPPGAVGRPGVCNANEAIFGIVIIATESSRGLADDEGMR